MKRVVLIRDGKTSTERILKQNYKEKLENIEDFESKHEEFGVLDKAGRLQISRDYLDELGITNKVKIELQDNKIIISAPIE